MGWIGVNEQSNSIPRESGQTSARSFMTRKFDETTMKGKQMTEELKKGSTGAPFHRATDWHAIDWRSVSFNVRRLHTRIVKATKEKRWGKVNAFQRLLTHSFSGKDLPLTPLAETQHKNTPGEDKRR